VIVIVNFKLLKRHSKTRCRAPAYESCIESAGISVEVVRKRSEPKI